MNARRWSFSAFEQYSRCGYQFHLDRNLKVPTRPSMAAVAGSAFHEWTELYDWHAVTDRADQFDYSAEDIFSDLVAQEEEESGLARDQWQISGRKTKDKPNKEDFACWRDTLLPDLCEKYINWRAQSPWQIATGLPSEHGSVPGIEYELVFYVGDTKIKAVADRIFVNEHGMLGVVDIKTWSRARGSIQLPTYVLGARKCGIDVRWAGYYNARTGAESQPQTFDSWDEDRLEALYDQARRMEASGFYLPRPSDDCRTFCKVSAHCEFAV